MATQDLEKLVVQMSVDLKSLERGLAKAQGTTTRELRKMERQAESSLSRIENVFSRFGKGLLAGAGIAGIGALGDFIQQTISQTAKIGDLADKLGLGTAALQELQYGAVQADLSFEDLDKSLLRFSKTLGEAANGQGEYLKTLRANGQEVQGTFLGSLKQLADLVKNAKNEQEALLIVTQAFGRGSDGMLEFLRDGSAGLQKFAVEAQNANAVIEDASIRTAQKIDDRWAALMQSLSQMTKQTVINIVDAFDSLAAAPNTEKILSARERILRGGTRFGNGSGAPVASAPARPDLETIRPAPGAGTVQPVTKIANPEKEAEDRRLLAERLREEKRARNELTRSIEAQFEAFTRDLEQTDEQVAAMDLEARTLGLTTGEIERQRIAQELLNAANREGIPVTEGLNQVIQDKAKAYGDAAQALEDLQTKQQYVEDQQEALRDSVKGFAQDLRSGVDPIDAITDALGRLADRLLDLALDTALDGLFKPGGGGLSSLAALVSHSGGLVGAGGLHRSVSPGVFAGARRMHSGGLAGDEVPAILQKGEIVLPKGFKPTGGGYGNITVNNYSGADVQVRERQRPDGRRDAEVQVRRIVTEEVAGAYSDTSLALGARGARNPIKRR